MNKANQFRSCDFSMSEGDVLHMLIKDETGTTVNIILIGEGGDDSAPGAVTALPATSITSSGFIANWDFIENANGYYFNLATDPDMTPHVLGYDNLDVGNVNHVHITGLTAGVTYYYQVSAYNDVGEGIESNIISTTIISILPLVDLDGNNYTTILIGNQEWIVENLKVTQYADTTAIPNVTLDANWIAEDGTGGHDGGYCWYSNNIANKAVYGALYNGYAVNNAHGLVYFLRNAVQETGWRIPTDADLDILATFLDGESVAGGKMKELGLTHWNPPNTGATNSSGFTAVGAGYRNIDGAFGALLDNTGFWCYEITPYPPYFLLYTGTGILYKGIDNPLRGRSVRCVRDIYIGTPYVEYTDPDTSLTYRKGVRDGALRIDVVLNVGGAPSTLGFSGVEDVDWANIKSI